MGQELSRSLIALRSAFPNQNLPEETVRIYAAALADLDAGAVDAAVASLIRSSRFFPTVAEIRATVAEEALDLPSPLAAWQEAEERSIGVWGDRPRHALVTETLRAVGGVWAIKTSESPVAIRAQFLKFYNERRAQVLGVFVQTGKIQLEPAPVKELPKGSDLGKLEPGELLAGLGVA